MIFIGSDHGGWNLKQEITKWLKSKKIEFEDVGAKILQQDDDYPDYAFPLVKKVVKNKENLGILISRDGIGMSIAANKIKGAKAALCTFVPQAITSRAHNNTNVLVLAAEFLDEEKAIKIVDMFLKAGFNEEERYNRILRKIDEIEK
ncbi:MAG TPA: RpiB/LacA/LacB family sugar-phosphate isomerase [Candidatus Bathyarchaeia archaeon]|nr:RpiB/LacA/LacB family sugar-phosphate isomerase [Candidatus Bathyarchaeia archaeon]